MHFPGVRGDGSGPRVGPTLGAAAAVGFPLPVASRAQRSPRPRGVGATVASRIEARLARLDPAGLEASLEQQGFALIPGLLTRRECERLAALWSEPGRFRSRVEMARHRFGLGEYRYFAAPLPAAVQALRAGLYARLAPIANRWAEALRREERVPATLDGFLASCRAQGQTKPTPLLLRYQAGGYNCLHQDLYGAVAFPLQLTVCLSRPGADFEGGEFLLVEQRPRAQSRGSAVALEQGQGIVFATRERPTPGSRGPTRVQLRHGVSTLRRGERFALGVIFHDAR